MTKIIQLIAVLMFLLVGAQSVIASESIEFQTKDGVTIHSTLVEVQNPKATIILLPMLSKTKESWKRVQEELAIARYQSLALDLRGHGQSTIKKGRQIHWRSFKTREFNKMTLDVEAAINHLSQELGVEPDSIYLMGASIGANIALKYAADHPKVQGVVLLSPGLNYRGVEIIQDAEDYAERPIFFAVSLEDLNSLEGTRHLSSKTSSFKLIELEDAGHGTRMFKSGILMEKVLDWLNANEGEVHGTS
jgi:pimeloyl-ACP methyl ester carboxylesterase